MCADRPSGWTEAAEALAARVSAACAPTFIAFGSRLRHGTDPDFAAYNSQMKAAARDALGITSVREALAVWHFVSNLLDSLEVPSSLDQENSDVTRQSLFAALEAAEDAALALPAADAGEAKARIAWHRGRFDGVLPAADIEQRFYARVVADIDALHAIANPPGQPDRPGSRSHRRAI